MVKLPIGSIHVSQHSCYWRVPPYNNFSFHHRQWDVHIAHRALLVWSHRPFGSKAMTLANDITTMLFRGEIRAVENDSLLSILKSANDVFFM